MKIAELKQSLINNTLIRRKPEDEGTQVLRGLELKLSDNAKSIMWAFQQYWYSEMDGIDLEVDYQRFVIEQNKIFLQMIAYDKLSGDEEI